MIPKSDDVSTYTINGSREFVRIDKLVHEDKVVIKGDYNTVVVKNIDIKDIENYLLSIEIYGNGNFIIHMEYPKGPPKVNFIDEGRHNRWLDKPTYDKIVSRSYSDSRRKTIEEKIKSLLED